ncbi:MAG: 3'-5' exonuclease [Taibaiella sp.]|nr:3'-5' exonuclease [Taibaiella sp.]
MEHLKHILFIDIETVPIAPAYELLPEAMQAEWNKKARFLKSSIDEDATPSMLFTEKAGIFSEFSKIVCIGFGSFHQEEKGWKLRLKSLINNDEKVLLNDFCTVLTRFADRYPNFVFCGHNIKEFDIPFICRRMIINNMGLPDCMQLNGKKPWQVPHLDTLELWKFGDYKHYTALSLLATVLGIPSPKSDIDGSQVGNVYWQDKDLERIARYCLQDVLTTAKVFLRLKEATEDFPEPVYVSDKK